MEVDNREKIADRRFCVTKPPPAASPSMMILEDLAVRALAGDRDALEALCRHLQGPLYRLALRILVDPSDAADATQEISIQVVTHLSQFRAESRLLTWAYAIGTRHLLRARRKRARTWTMEVVESRLRQGLAITTAASEPDGDVRLLARETRLGCTNAMMACLTVEERVAVVLVEMLGADDALAAHLSEVSLLVHKKRLSRARTKLRPVLEDLCGLARSDAPCTCVRQSRAKQLAGVPGSSSLRKLPVVADPELQRAVEALGALRRLGPVFAVEPFVDPPMDVWHAIKARLPAVLEAPEC